MEASDLDLMSRVMPLSPLREPHWRWLLAQAPARHPAFRYADRWVRRARLWELRKRYKSKLRTAVLRLRDEEDLVVRNYLEAGILAGMTGQALASVTAIPPEVIEAYSALFFDVEGRRDCSDWIKNVVVGDSDSVLGNELYTVWKWVGYRGGPMVLDLLVQGTVPSDSRHRFNFERDLNREQLFLARLWGAVLTLPWKVTGALTRIVRRVVRGLQVNKESPGADLLSILRPLLEEMESRLGLSASLTTRELTKDYQKQMLQMKSYRDKQNKGLSPVCGADPLVHRTRK